MSHMWLPHSQMEFLGITPQNGLTRNAKRLLLPKSGRETQFIVCDFSIPQLIVHQFLVCTILVADFMMKLYRIFWWFRFCQLAFSPPQYTHIDRPLSFNTLALEIEANIHLPVEPIELSLLPQRPDGCGVNIALCPSSFWMQHNSVILSGLLLGEIHKDLQGHRNIRIDMLSSEPKRLLWPWKMW